jgi:DNA-binding beta-propeller fold protein YncE
MVRTGGSPFGVVSTSDGRWSFVDEDRGPNGDVAVFSDSQFTPRLVRTIALSGSPAGDALTPSGRYLLAAEPDGGVVVVSVARAETGAMHAVLGVLRGAGGGSIEVTTSPDSRYVFASNEVSSEVSVYDLQAAMAHGFATSGYIGAIRLGRAVVGTAVSPDGRWLYATSERAAGAPPTSFQGTLTVISLAAAETDPSHAVIATVAAGCSPVRVVVSADGRTVWVTARASDELLAFSAAKLRSDPSHALIATVRVGEAPVGLVLIAGGQSIVVANSNRVLGQLARSDLTVVSTAQALSGRPAVLGTIPAGEFPREMSLEPNGRTLLVTNYDSDQIEAIEVPGGP